MFKWLKKSKKSNKEIAIDKFKKAGLSFEEADYLAQDVAELNLYLDNKLFNGYENNAHSLEEAYKDSYYLKAVNTLIDENLPIKAIASTGIKARAIGLPFEVRIAIRNSVFEYLKDNELDNTYFEKIFMDTLETVEFSNKEDLVDELNFLYKNGYILDHNDKQYNEIIKMMKEHLKPDNFIDYIGTILSEGAGWYKQVNNPESQLQKITHLSLIYIGGQLEDIKDSLLNSNLTPFDIMINIDEYKEKVYTALEHAEEYENFPQMDNEYRNEVAGRFLQYLQEELRLNIINSRINSIDEIQHIIEELNSAKIDYGDIENVYPIYSEYLNELFFEMNNEKNFSIFFENNEDLQMAWDLVKCKSNITTFNKREEKFKLMNADTQLLDFPKMSFTDFINQYELSDEELEAVYKWQEQQKENYYENEEEKTEDFSNYDLAFIPFNGKLIATVVKKDKSENYNES